MPTRRSFTFGSLALAVTGPQIAHASPRADAPRLTVTATGRLRRGSLLVELRITNPAPEPVQVVTMRGAMPGPTLTATLTVGGERIALALASDGDRGDVRRTRAGPLPQWMPLVQDDPMPVGPYTFGWPDGVPAAPIHLTVHVQTDQGMVEHVQRLTVADS